MKQLIIFLLLLTVLPAKTQCNAINVNTFVLKHVGVCKYVIEINASLNNGNASVKAFYTCDNHGNQDLPNCFTWENPSTKSFTSDTFTCCGVVRVGIRGYASANCHGHECIEVQLTNLPIVIISAEKTVKPKSNALEYNTISRQLIIAGKDFNPRTLRIYTLLGQQVWEKQVDSNTITIPQFAPGIYFVVVVTTTKDNLIKTIIQ